MSDSKAKLFDLTGHVTVTVTMQDGLQENLSITAPSQPNPAAECCKKGYHFVANFDRDHDVACMNVSQSPESAVSDSRNSGHTARAVV
jgi:hypothetical protein